MSIHPNFKFDTAEKHGINVNNLVGVVFMTSGNYIVFADRSEGPKIVEGLKKKGKKVSNAKRWSEAHALTPPTRGYIFTLDYFDMEGKPNDRVLIVSN